METVTAYIGLGSNLGNKNENVSAALKMIDQMQGCSLVQSSTLLETKPLGGKDQPGYLNAAAKIETKLEPLQLLNALQIVEGKLGRTRSEKWDSRTIDLDILLYANQVIETDELTVPHREMHLRSFVLEGLCELDASLVHPVIGETIERLRYFLNGNDFMLDAKRPQLVCTAGLIGVGKTTLANQLAELWNCPMLPEPYDTNPFLPKVYAGKKEAALSMELYFLVNRAQQIGTAALDAGSPYVADYVFDKNRLYAQKWLDPDQFALYDSIYPLFAADVCEPMLVLYLEDTAENCLQRIKTRNRPYEQNITIGFLEQLEGLFSNYFNHYNVSPVVRLDAKQLDYSKPECMETLNRKIKAYLSL